MVSETHCIINGTNLFYKSGSKNCGNIEVIVSNSQDLLLVFVFVISGIVLATLTIIAAVKHRLVLIKVQQLQQREKRRKQPARPIATAITIDEFTIEL